VDLIEIGTIDFMWALARHSCPRRNTKLGQHTSASTALARRVKKILFIRLIMYSTSLTAIFVFLYRKVNKTYDVAVMVSIDQPAPRKNDSDALGCLKRTRGHGPAPDRPRRQYRGPRFDLLLEALSCTVVTVSLDFTP
jgi:hypothetical protein